jgi:hypothetical protein
MKQIEYEGRWITIDVVQRGNGWSWTYQIDTGPIRSSEDRPLPSEAIMEAEAEHAAKREIDRAKKLQGQ